MQILKSLLFIIPLFFIFLNCSVGQNVKSCDSPSLDIIPPTESFVKVLILDDFDGSIKGSGSGIIINQLEKSTVILTVKHVCINSKDMEKEDPEISIVGIVDFKGVRYDSIVAKLDPLNDLCLIATINKKIDVDVVLLAGKKPRVGMHVYNLAAPIGFFNAGMVPIFEGFYSGDRTKGFYSKDKIHNTGYSVYTIPGMGGSSGSAILNSKFELIGIVSLGLTRFNNLMVAVDYVSVKHFLNSQQGLELVIDLKVKKRNLETVRMLQEMLDARLHF